MELDDAVSRGRLKSIQAASSTFRVTATVTRLLGWVVAAYGVLKLWLLLDHVPVVDLLAQIADTVVLFITLALLTGLSRRASIAFKSTALLFQDLVKTP